MSSSPTPDPKPDFASRAATYDELRPGIPGLHEALADVADLRGRRVLDIGCGTGRFGEMLATRFGAQVFGVDAEPEMVAVARRRDVRGAIFEVGRAERLPFEDDWFERATMVLVCHLLDRPAAFAEVRRVLRADGRLGLATFDPGYFPHYFLNAYFPTMLEADLARFPSADTLRAELLAAGFSAVTVTPFVREIAVGREAVLARVRGRHISTFDLIGEDEYRRGLERAERELPQQVLFRFEMLVVTGE